MKDGQNGRCGTAGWKKMNGELWGGLPGSPGAEYMPVCFVRSLLLPV